MHNKASGQHGCTRRSETQRNQYSIQALNLEKTQAHSTVQRYLVHSVFFSTHKCSLIMLYVMALSTADSDLEALHRGCITLAVRALDQAPD